MNVKQDKFCVLVVLSMACVLCQLTKIRFAPTRELPCTNLQHLTFGLLLFTACLALVES